MCRRKFHNDIDLRNMKLVLNNLLIYPSLYAMRKCRMQPTTTAKNMKPSQMMMLSSVTDQFLRL